MVLCLLVFALTFPGSNRFGQRPLNAAVDIAWSWLGLVLILLLCGHATDSLRLFEPRLLLVWALTTPALALAGGLQRPQCPAPLGPAAAEPPQRGDHRRRRA
jgi:putative colanic acid biosynthesis UDP-glucose lipid carrier transferase